MHFCQLVGLFSFNGKITTWSQVARMIKECEDRGDYVPPDIREAHKLLGEDLDYMATEAPDSVLGIA